jgi:hypothetical protein
MAQKTLHNLFWPEIDSKQSFISSCRKQFPVEEPFTVHQSGVLTRSYSRVQYDGRALAPTHLMNDFQRGKKKKTNKCYQETVCRLLRRGAAFGVYTAQDYLAS